MTKLILALLVVTLCAPLLLAQDAPRSENGARRGKWDIVLTIVATTIQSICDNTGKCILAVPSNNYPTNEGKSPQGPAGEGTYPDGSRMSFAANYPAFNSGDTVIIAQRGQYRRMSNGGVDLYNGVMLYPAQQSGGSLESELNRFADETAAANDYLRSQGRATTQYVDGMECRVANYGGTNPNSRAYENVGIYVCDDNSRRLYFVTVASGPNANYYHTQNQRVIDSLRRQH